MTHTGFGAIRDTAASRIRERQRFDRYSNRQASTLALQYEPDLSHAVADAFCGTGDAGWHRVDAAAIRLACPSILWLGIPPLQENRNGSLGATAQVPKPRYDKLIEKVNESLEEVAEN